MAHIQRVNIRIWYRLNYWTKDEMLDNIKVNREWNTNMLMKLIDTYGNDWIKISRIMNRSKSSVYRQYIFIKYRKSDEQIAFVQKWVKILRYKVDSKVLEKFL